MQIGEALALQARHIEAYARRLGECGYCVEMCGWFDADNRMPFGYINGAITQFVGSWNKAKGTHYVVISAHLFDGDGLHFSCRIPRRAWSVEIITALRLLGRFSKMTDKTYGTSNRTFVGSGLFNVTECRDFYEVVGANKLALKSFLRVLDMPQHRAILLRSKTDA